MIGCHDMLLVLWIFGWECGGVYDFIQWIYVSVDDWSHLKYEAAGNAHVEIQPNMLCITWITSLQQKCMGIMYNINILGNDYNCTKLHSKNY